MACAWRKNPPSPRCANASCKPAWKPSAPLCGGGDDASEGFDCSGLVLHVFREIAGLELPRTARQQRTEGEAIKNKQNLRPGDLVFFATRGRGVTSHVGIYIGQNKFVHARAAAPRCAWTK